MSRSDLVRVLVRASPTMEVAISDAQFRVISAGAGHLDVEIPPGPYALHVSEAGITHYKDLFLDARSHEITIDVPPVTFVSSTPLDHTSATCEWHRSPAIECSEKLLREHAQGLFVFVREVMSSIDFDLTLSTRDSQRGYVHASDWEPSHPGVGLTVHDAGGGLCWTSARTACVMRNIIGRRALSMFHAAEMG